MSTIYDKDKRKEELEAEATAAPTLKDLPTTPNEKYQNGTWDESTKGEAALGTYTDAKVIKLEQNYRSTKNILSAANAVIAHNSDRHRKTLWCDKEEGEKITVRECDTADAECRYIIDTVLHRVVHERKK